MTQKRERVESIVDQFRGRELDAHYLAFFDCFNQQLFYEAHEVLEALWLGQRQGTDGDFYKGLIQLAGGFVHVQKNRPGPATALFKLAQGNLGHYPPLHQRLELTRVHELISEWLTRLAGESPPASFWVKVNGPKLVLQTVQPHHRTGIQTS